MRCARRLIAAAFAFLLLATAAAEPVVVGSKRFTESYILGEIVRETLARAGVEAVHTQGLGNTGILEQALATGSIDVYPEYTGTIVRELLGRTPPPGASEPSLDQLNEWLAPRGLKAAVPLGFNNTYALAMTEARAEALGIRRVSDLPQAADLRVGLSHEFLVRADGWPALAAAYGLPHRPTGLDHGLAYDALAAGTVDVIDIYSTDAKVGRLGLRVLEDDRRFFPAYDAVLLMRAELDAAPLAVLSGRIDERTMIALNAQVELDGQSFAAVAQRFVAGGAVAGPAGSGPQTLWQRIAAPDFARLAFEHLLLVFGSVLLAVLAAVPLGVAAWRWPRSAGALLAAVGVLQTIPSLALLAFLIVFVGRIGFVPALIALFLYALLPIVRNTHAGLRGVGRDMSDAARSLGMRDRQVLRHVELPLALPMVLAGIKTAAVINVGTATMAAFIGAGGFGERIVAGLAVNDTDAMLAGALPAAALALVVQAVFALLERGLTRRHSPAA